MPQPLMLQKLKVMILWRITTPSRTKTKPKQNKNPFHHRGLECKLRSKEVLVLPMNIQVWLPLGDCLICLLSKRLSRVFSSNTDRKHQFFHVQPSLWSNSHPYLTTGKTIALTRQTFAIKVTSLLCNMPSRLVIAFLPMSKHLLISWLKSSSAVFWSPRK